MRGLAALSGFRPSLFTESGLPLSSFHTQALSQRRIQRIDARGLRRDPSQPATLLSGTIDVDGDRGIVCELI